MLRIAGVLAQPWFAAAISIPRSLWLSKKLDDLYGQAQELEKKGQKDKALSYYLEVFEKSRDCVGWGGVRLSYLLGSIVRMDYKPARQALLNLRMMRECEMLAGMSDDHILQEWHSINDYIGEQRTLKFFDELSWQEFDVSDVLQEIKVCFPEDFVKERRYAEYNPSDLAKMKHILKLIFSTFRTSKGFQQYLSTETAQILKTSIVKQEVLTFEIAIARGWNDDGSEVARMLIEIDPTWKTF